MKDELIEKLAELEHIQWEYWSQNIAETEKISPERLERWKQCWKSYNQLDEKTKEQDRKWAKKVIKIINKHNHKDIPNCKEFTQKIIAIGSFENKVRYLLEDFFFKEGWSKRTNPKNMKEGYNSELTYNEDIIKHFIEDFIRFAKKEYEIKLK